MRGTGTVKKDWFFIFILFLGAIGGDFIGDVLGDKFKSFSFIKNIYSIGTSKPFSLDLKIISLTFGININFNIMTIIGIILAIIVYKKFN